MNNFSKITAALLFIGFLTNSFAEDILLECKVNGRFNGVRLDPATVQVTISEFVYLSIDIDGPTDYSQSFIDKNFETKGRVYTSRNTSNENIYYLSNSVTHPEITKHDSTVSINRLSGTISVTDTLIKNGKTYFTDYSGNCYKISNKKKF